MTEITVVNIRHSQCDVLIDRKTIFGNPFPECEKVRKAVGLKLWNEKGLK